MVRVDLLLLLMAHGFVEIRGEFQRLYQYKFCEIDVIGRASHWYLTLGVIHKSRVQLRGEGDCQMTFL